jgi:hypothetical protein
MEIRRVSSLPAPALSFISDGRRPISLVFEGFVGAGVILPASREIGFRAVRASLSPRLRIPRKQGKR